MQSADNSRFGANKSEINLHEITQQQSQSPAHIVSIVSVSVLKQ